MKVYHKILVTIDCSPVDDSIIRHVTELAIQNEAKIILLHVVHSHTLDQDRALREKAEKILKDYSQELESKGISVQIILRSGEPDREILSEIEQQDCDLVAMATHGHSFLGDMLFGSVSRTLKHKIRIPLLLIGS
jgi:nucleotide-binding universal stress UspA family protein